MKIKKYSHYTEEDIDTELLAIKKNLGHFPTVGEIRKVSQNLSNAIYKSGFNIIYFRNKHKEKIIKKPNGYWLKFDNLANEIKPFIKNKIFPTMREIQKGCGVSTEIITLFGGLRKVAEKMGYKLTTFYQASDGHYLRSSYECIVDEFLYAKGIKHDVDGKICDDFNYRYDFKINDYYVEIWGYQDYEKYEIIKLAKTKIYNDLNLKLISINFSIFKKSAPEIKKSLEDIFSIFGENYKHKFNIEDIIRTNYFWNEEKIIKSINKLIAIINHFPSTKEMQCVQGLIQAIQKHNGINFFRKKMGYAPNREKIQWNNESILKELKQIKNLKQNISHRFLRKHNRSLLEAAYKHGGLAHYQKLIKI